MVNRLANFAHHQLLNSHLFKLQSNLFDAQIAVASEKKTQEYAGIPDQSERLVRLEHLTQQSEQFISNNQVVDLRMQSQDIALVGVEDSIRNMYDMISDYSSGERRDAEQVEQVQKFAYQALRDIQGFLNESMAGRYLFSGSRTAQAPVDLGLQDNLAAFQAKWDGNAHKYPETRDAHVSEFGVSFSATTTLTTTVTGTGTGDNEYMEIQIGGYGASDYANFKVGSSINLNGTSNDGDWTVTAVSGTYIRVKTEHTDTETINSTLTFERGSNDIYSITDATMDFNGSTITAGTGGAGTFDDVEVPSTITVSNGGNNNGKTLTVTGVSADGSALTVSQKVGAAATDTAGTLTLSNYYNGDLMETSHRVDENRTIDININGLNPAFDKAIRALSIIAQGEFGSAGGLDQNTGRADDALWLLDSALDFPTDGTPPYGAEDNSSIEQLRFNTAFDRKQIENSIEREERTINFLKTSIGEIEDINMLEATTELLDIDRALQASYQVLSRTQKLGLSNFL